MHSLFLDTTAGLTVGLLDDQFTWLDYESNNEKRPSEYIHEKIFSMLNKFNLQLNHLRVITVAGPGSYTGMRLTEGFSDIVNWSGIKILSFYHFEVPQFTGVQSGRWTTNAFKNQVFSYQWHLHGSSTELLLECVDANAFTIDMTRELIYSQPTLIFSKVVQLNEKKESYYFRTLEEEFG